MVHPRLVQPLELLIIKRARQIQPSINAPILGVIGLIAGAVLLISETSSYLWTVSPLHNFADGALFGRAF